MLIKPARHNNNGYDVHVLGAATTVSELEVAERQLNCVERCARLMIQLVDHTHNEEEKLRVERAANTHTNIIDRTIMRGRLRDAGCRPSIARTRR